MTQRQNPLSKPQSQLVLLISGDGIDFEAISDALGLKSTDVRHKGEVINRLPQIVAEHDEWYHEIELTESNDVDTAMNDLLETLAQHKEKLSALQDRYAIILRMHVKSDYARIFYRLMPDTLARLAKTGVPLEVSVLSWGKMPFQTVSETE
ncbi:DUF4279 domain-containing protein [Beduinella massiliensis]|uniref:DUF4279 domain-containing protein n=1 Tax=Beduinella massiliensis TaxID=1852363 RepID=UPI000C8476A4